jgi:hypothetical protein
MCHLRLPMGRLYAELLGVLSVELLPAAELCVLSGKRLAIGN